MTGLADLPLRTSYHKGRDNIAEDFYLPCMRLATTYDRAVGYFRSAAFIVAWPALRDFVKNAGKLRILCSQVLASDDVDALDHGYAARSDALLAARLLEEVRGLLNDSVLRAPTRILAALVANGTLDLQVAILAPTDVNTARGRIFHDKLGIFRDSNRNVVIFKGSMNETWSGLAADGNLESVDVAASWMGARDLERAKNEERYFDDLWANNYPSLKVRPFPEVAKAELTNAADPDWESSLDSMLSEERQTPAADTRGRSLLSHQAAGLAAWNANGRKGILDFATGSGKTFTAICAIRECITCRKNPVLVVVPDQVLFLQWYTELRETTRDLGVQILRAGAGHDHWRASLASWTTADVAPRLVLATVQTAASEDFRQRLAGGSHLVLIADEVHRLGSPHHQQLLDDAMFGARLGLSATPERYGDPEGTARLLAFFGGILEPRYTLQDAIRDNVLCKYFYRPHPIQLSEDEAAEWGSLSKQIAQLAARGKVSGSADHNERIQLLFIKRARIVKHAAAKIPLAADVLRTDYVPGQRWIVYCEDTTQLEAVVVALKVLGIDALPFHSQMEGDRPATLRWFERQGGVVAAIKCLDEGVDIPSVTHALILASSKNPREFIQRRGRVLRKAPNKALAYVYDAIVLPPPEGRGGDMEADPITAGELARAVEFAQYATNPAAGGDLQEIALTMGLDWQNLQKSGTEDDEI
jgi:superfamily II DNA or RNA helicase